jgi:sugar lactone lactonase YvrE
LHTFHPQQRSDICLKLGEAIGCAAPCANGDLILALRSGFARFEPGTLGLSHLLDPEKHLPGNRFNDGKCDPGGRFLAGTMDDAERANTGSLYSYAPDGTLRTLLTGLGISNGLAWSPDARTFYHIDTPTRQVCAYEYDPASGCIGQARPAVSIPPELGWPDGMTSDTDGMLWVAMWAGARSPAGTLPWPIAGGACPCAECHSCIFMG